MQVNPHKKATWLKLTALVLLAGMYACEPQESDTTPPGEVSNISVESTNGGAVISYDLPQDEDLHYIRAVYTNSQGNEVYKVASYYNTSIEVDGFNDTLSHDITLFAVDRSNNQSDGVTVSVTPLVSHIHIVKENLTLEAALGGVEVTWQNPVAKQVFVYLYIEDESTTEERILSSSLMNETKIVRGLDSVNYDISIVVEDFNGNKTDRVFKETIKPLFEEKISKDSWKLVPSLSADGNIYEGVTTNFWDDVIDRAGDPSDNSYFIIHRDNNGGTLTYPLDLVVDLDKQVIINRLVVWQRAYDYTSADDGGVSTTYEYYQTENMRSFNLWASNDLSEWLLLGEFDIGDPRNDEGEVPPEKIQEAIDGHEFVLDEITEPFRYLKISLTSGYGSETLVCSSEITLFGIDNVDVQ